jgi:hypothetical protein
LGELARAKLWRGWIAVRRPVNVKDIALAMDFFPVDGKSEVYGKPYSQYGGYSIYIDIARGRVEYADNPSGRLDVLVKDDYWNKTFKDNGIFESCAAPYNIVHKRLTYGMLQNMKADDSGKIYNHIMEILRHNGISDKPNAFNKLLNLFVCKIIGQISLLNTGLTFSGSRISR